MNERWQAAGGQHGSFAAFIREHLIFMASQVVKSCLLLMLVVTISCFVCPDALSLASACLAKNNLAVHSLVVVVWGGFCSEARQPWWSRTFVASRREPSHPGGLVEIWPSSVMICCSWLCWVLSWLCWILIIVMFSAFMVVHVAKQCIPSFFAANRAVTELLDMSIGMLQGLITGLLVPSLASGLSKISEVRKVSLMSVATTLCTLLIPAAVVCYLDGACAGYWVLWWMPCRRQRHAGIFDVVVWDEGIVQARPLSVLRHQSVCSPSANPSLALCVRSMALKLQEIMLGKLMTVAFLLPAWKLLRRRREIHLHSLDTVIMKLILLLELGMVLGPSLPLLMPLLYMAVMSERLLAAVAWEDGALVDSSESGVGLDIMMTSWCSFLFYVCFVSESSLASGFLYIWAAFLHAAPRRDAETLQLHMVSSEKPVEKRRRLGGKRKHARRASRRMDAQS